MANRFLKQIYLADSCRRLTTSQLQQLSRKYESVFHNIDRFLKRCYKIKKTTVTLYSDLVHQFLQSRHSPMGFSPAHFRNLDAIIQVWLLKASTNKRLRLFVEAFKSQMTPMTLYFSLSFFLSSFVFFLPYSLI